MTDGSAPVPGWYEDPKGPGQLRYWDGAQWSEHTQPMPGAVQSAAEAPVAAEQVFPQEDQPGPGYSQESFDYQPETAFDDYSAGTSGPVAEPGNYDAAGSYAEPRGYTEAAGYQGAAESLADSAEESAVPPAAAPGFEQPPVSAFGQSPADLESGFGESPTFYAPAAGAVGSTPGQPGQPESGYPQTQAPAEFPPGAPEAPYPPQPGAASGFSAPPQASPPAGQYPPGQYPQGQYPAWPVPAGAEPARVSSHLGRTRQGQYPPGAVPTGAESAGPVPAGAKPARTLPTRAEPARPVPTWAKPAGPVPARPVPTWAEPAGPVPAGTVSPRARWCRRARPVPARVWRWSWSSSAGRSTRCLPAATSSGIWTCRCGRIRRRTGRTRPRRPVRCATGNGSASGCIRQASGRPKPAPDPCRRHCRGRNRAACVGIFPVLSLVWIRG